MEQDVERMINFMSSCAVELERVLDELKPLNNSLEDTLEYDRKVAQLKEIKKLLKQLKNGTK